MMKKMVAMAQNFPLINSLARNTEEIDALVGELARRPELVRAALMRIDDKRQLARAIGNPDTALPYMPRYNRASHPFDQVPLSDLALSELIQKYEFNTVLDVGAGSGKHAQVFHQAGKSVTKLDFGVSVYARNAEADSIRSVVADANTVDLPEQFDCVWASHVLEHQPNVKFFLQRLQQWAKPDGLIVITVPPAKFALAGGHLTLWTPGLLLYNLVISGIDCSKAAIYHYGYNISVIVRNNPADLPDLHYDKGDINRLRRFLPPGLREGDNGFMAGSSGRIEAGWWIEEAIDPIASSGRGTVRSALLHQTAIDPEVVRSLIFGSISAGHYEAAIDLYERLGPQPDLLLSFLEFAFFNRMRSRIGAFVHRHVGQLASTDRAYALSKIINLAEMDGDVPRLAKALRELIALLQKLGSEEITTTDALRFAQSALTSFQVHAAEALLARCKQDERLSAVSAQIALFKDKCELAGFDPYDLDRAANHIAEGRVLSVNKATVVVRITSNIWKSLTTTDDPLLLPDGLQYAHFLRGQGYQVALAPQFALPGPSLMTPYADQSPVIFVDQHKYSARADRFVHIKSTHNKRVLVDRLGYSGWAEVQRAPSLHPLDRIPATDATAYCDQQRREMFQELSNVPSAFAEWGRFGVIPLQMPGDSVQILGRFPFHKMIEASVKFLHQRGLTAVVRRHPQCRDPEVSTYLSSLLGDGVFIVDQNTRQIILHADAVLLCNSSVGWDAILAHKPLICFGDAEYSRVAYNVHSLADLHEAPPLDAMPNTLDYDRLYYYYYNAYVSRSRKGTLKRLHEKVRNLLSELATFDDPGMN